MKIVILTAKCGLGTYIPAVYTYKYMRSHSVDTEMLVWEDFYETNNKERAMLFQKNPRIAEISYAYDNNKQPTFSTTTKSILNRYLDKEHVTYICFSGIWHYELLTQVKVKKSVIINVVMDAYHSTLWDPQIEDEATNTTTLYALGENIYTLNNEIKITDYKERRGILVQGGGWNLIDRNQIRTLQTQTKENLIVALTNDDPQITGNKILYNQGESCNFPYPINRDYVPDTNYHPLLDEYRKARCCVGKPGGMTIIDSIMTCTPLLLTDVTIGQHEQANRFFCKKNGLAIELQNLNYNQIVTQLERLHERLIDISASAKNLCLTLLNLI